MGLPQSVHRFYKIFILLMALAKTNNTIATIGRNIPIPFSETKFLQINLVNDIQTIPIKLNLI
jgi:hypothetical protein